MDIIGNFIFLYHVIIASENLLKVAARETKGPLRDYYFAHLREETGHAAWLADDLKSVGVDVKRTKLPPEAMEMVGSIYYLIYHVSPAALLGYILAMEGHTISVEQVEELEKHYPKQLIRTLRYHAEHDGEHTKDVLAMIETRSPQDRLLIEQTRKLTRGYIALAGKRFSELSQKVAV